MNLLGINSNNHSVAPSKSDPTSASSSNIKEKSLTDDLSISSLALKMKDAEQAIESAFLEDLDKVQFELNTNSESIENRDELAAVKQSFEHLSKSNLEVIALEPNQIFSNTEKIAAREQWYELDQAELFKLRLASLSGDNNANTLSFEESLTLHIDSLSPLGQKMLSSDYKQDAVTQFELSKKELAQPSSISNEPDYYAVMVKDVFGGNEPDILSATGGLSLYSTNRSYVEYLTHDDRVLLASFYEHADQNNIDFEYIRRFASDLGDYRMHNNGRLILNFNEGHFDVEGHQLTVAFNEKDQSSINSLLESNSLSSNVIDRGFVSYATEPGLSAIKHVGSYQFLEYIMDVSAGEVPTTPASDFTEFKEFSSTTDRYVLSVSEEKIATPVADVICQNGHCSVTSSGKANGVKLEASESQIIPTIDSKTHSIDTIWQRRTNSETKQIMWFQWILENQLSNKDIN